MRHLNILERIQERTCGCVCVPDEVWFCDKLTPTDVKLYKVFLDYSRDVLEMKSGKLTQDGVPVITVSQKTLAERVGVSERTIQGCIKRLREVKLILVDDYKGFKRNNNYMLCEEFFEEKGTERRLEVVEKPIKRVPIIRKAIKINKVKSYEEKLRELGGHTYTEKAIIAISNHYNMLASKFNHLSGYRSLPKKNPQTHKNWKYFEKLHRMCVEKGWDSKLYLEAQFERAKKYWKNSKIKYPLPSMLCSEKSQQFFERWYEERKEKYAFDVRKHKVVARKTESVKQRIIREIVQSIENISMYIIGDTEEERAESKALRIYHSWESYSPSYLYSIPWFKEYLNEIQDAYPDREKIETYMAEFQLFDRSKKLQGVIEKTVEIVENNFDVPSNIAI